jgi:large subunit GTPase 1
MELHKPMILLFNKSDYLSKQQRKIWKQYFTSDDNNNNHDDGNDENQTDHSSKIASSDPHYHPHRHNWTQNCHIIFFSAMREQKKLDQLAAMERKRIQLELLTQQEEDNDNNNNASIFGNRNDYDDDNSSDEEDDDDDDEHDHDRETNNPEDENEPDDDNDDDITKALEDPNPDEDEDDIHDTDEKDEEDDEDNDDDDDDDVRILTRAELIETMRTFAKEHHCQAEERYDYRIQYGMVGFPNVGKSSVINVLAGASKHTHNTVRVAVASQPGKTKHFQTVLLQDQQDIMLCDCPGLVFPSFVSSTADLIAAGVYPIAQMRDHWPVTHLVCQRIPRNILNAHYGITLPVLSHQQLQDRGYDPARNNNTNDDDDDDELPPPTAEELLTTYCIARGLLASFSGVPDFQRAARIIIKDYADGKLLYCHPPPNMTTTELKEFYSHTVQTALRNTQRTRERLLKQQQKLQVQQSTVDEGTTSRNKKNNQNHTTKQHGTTKQMTALDAFDDELIQMIAATTLPTSSTTATNNHDPTHRKSNRRMISSDANTSNSHKLHYKKSAGAKWGKKDRKNRNKDPYGCHTATPDNTVLSMI